MKPSLLLSAIASTLAASALAAVPTVSDATLSQSHDRTVTITYTLSDAPGIVTCDILTNGVSIGASNLTHFSGDVNRLVENGPAAKTIRWTPTKAWPDHIAEATAVVTAWETNSPPAVMVVDLLGHDPVAYYTDVACLTGGVADNPVYSTSKLVLRRIHAKDIPWTMGCLPNEIGYNASCNEYVHNVTLGGDYYIGVFEITQYQWYLLCGNRPSNFKNELHWERRPVESVSYRQIRDYIFNRTDGATGTNEYPADPHAQSFLGKLRTRTGLAFDLPSEAQWEYACRAGHFNGRWNDGSLIMASTAEDTNLNALARYAFTGGNESTDAQADSSSATAPVGSYAPNGWGLYDMHGNVLEYCLDWYSTQAGDPALDISGYNGAVNCDGLKALDGNNGRHKVVRGGCYANNAERCRSGTRINHVGSWSGNASTGFRVCLNIGGN